MDAPDLKSLNVERMTPDDLSKVLKILKAAGEQQLYKELRDLQVEYQKGMTKRIREQNQIIKDNSTSR